MRPTKHDRKKKPPTSELFYGTPHNLGPLPDTRKELCSCQRERLRNIFYEANLHVWRYQITSGQLDQPQYRAWDASDPTLAQLDTVQTQADADIEAGFCCEICTAKKEKRWCHWLSWKQWILLLIIALASFGLGVFTCRQYYQIGCHIPRLN
ncbi:Protein of unknown function [Pyronema omphalodes CBS 100304]|uniref:Uncharacterized protein n=1 Tax=Pyronema omphalodes (strain CBS 100304) TaxID=1076935 RepID=U4L7S0_PYROM|nr:Protein of unknown function [Pyronema omphalodes CBS 100304]